MATATTATATPIAHCSQLPRIQTRGLVKKYLESFKERVMDFYNPEQMGYTMEFNVFNVHADTDQKSRYANTKEKMLSVNYFGDFTLDMLFRMMNIRDTIDERTAMEIAGFIQLYLPQRPFTKVPITVNSVDSDGNPVTKVLEVKLYYAYEFAAVQWLVQVFFNRLDLIV